MNDEEATQDHWTRVLELAEACGGESNGFSVVAPFSEVDPSRPLYVLVHPGDVVQTRSDVAGSPIAERILAYSVDRQEEMARDVEVLHRFSSSYGFGTSGTVDLYEFGIDDIHRDGAVLFGDALAAAGAWLLREASAADRPAVVLSGAWSEERHGCVTMVGEVLEAGGAQAYLAASACVSPDGGGREWAPKAGRVSRDEALSLWSPPSPSPA
jgi:hypothetical protein